MADTPRLGFVAAQVAGHVTNYRNLRRIAESDPDIEPVFVEIPYHREGGSIERFADRVGRGMILRPLVELWRVDDRRFDAMFLNSNGAEFFPWRFHRTPTMYDFDATPVQLDAMPEYDRSLGSAPVRRTKEWLTANLWDGLARLQAWSEWAKASAVEDYGISPEKVVVNPPGVDLELWSPGASQPSSDSDVRRILFVGGDFRRKGGHVLLDWFRRSARPDVELHLVTREPVDATPGVHVYDSLQPNSAELLELYRTADVFALPTTAECFGISTVEAMASGLPVVVTTVAASPEIVDDGENGYLVPPDDSGALGSALERLLDDADLRRRMGIRSRSIAEERFDLGARARQTVASLKEIAGSDG